MAKNKGLRVSLSSLGVGYKVCILVNGKDTGIRGEISESKLFYSPKHEKAQEMATAMRKKAVLLKDGPNQFVIDFKKIGDATDTLTVEIFADGDVPVFKLTSSAKASGKINRTVNLTAGSMMTMTDGDIKP